MKGPDMAGIPDTSGISGFLDTVNALLDEVGSSGGSSSPDGGA